MLKKKLVLTHGNFQENLKYKDNKYYHPIDMRLPHIPKHLIKYRINPKSLINAHDFPDIDSLVAEIKRIDSDKEAFKAILRAPVFLDNPEPNIYEHYTQELKAFLEYIFSQSPQDASRRGSGQWLSVFVYNKFKNYNKKSLSAQSADSKNAPETAYMDYVKNMEYKMNEISILVNRYFYIAKFINKILIYRLIPAQIIRKIRSFFRKRFLRADK